MTRDEIIAKLKEAAPALRAEGVKRLMPHTLVDLLFHATDSINNIQMFLSRGSAGALTTDKAMRMAVERSLEIISEAVQYIPDDAKARQPDIEWSLMSDLGDRLRRDYYLIDANLLIQIIERDLPPLKAFAQRIIHGPEP
jgi:uncharacterized protein with HEPN domain